MVDKSFGFMYHFFLRGVSTLSDGNVIVQMDFYKQKIANSFIYLTIGFDWDEGKNYS